MTNFALELYRQMVTSLKRGNTKGVFSNAKPIFLLSIIDYIPQMKEKNQFKWEVKEWQRIYEDLYKKMENSKTTPFWKPFYYMSSEPFYSLKWETMPTDKALKFPSGKTLKDHLAYAQLDAELWELLQEEENRAYLRQCIINTYLTK